MAEALKLRGEDEEDLAVISAILQDALVAVGEMAYFPDESRFVLVANRFRWEPQPGGNQRLERRLSGLRIDGVRAVRRRGFSPADTERLLVLLAIRAEGGALYLDFAGDSSVCLDVERILCYFDDLGEPWPTRWRPKHPVEEG
jgi:Protein of unknown function (DUF2948)